MSYISNDVSNDTTVKYRCKKRENWDGEFETFGD